MLRRRSRGVARFSQHMLGKAMDFYIPGVSLEKVRVAGLRLQRGGVGFYPTSGSPFVHLDTGNVRHWPRMTHDQLARVFPDGKTVHVPSDGQPLRNYAVAMADLQRRGGSAAGEQTAERPQRNFLRQVASASARDDEDEGETRRVAARTSGSRASRTPCRRVARRSPPVPMPRVRPQPRGASSRSRLLSPRRRQLAAQVIAERGIWDNVTPPRPPASIPTATASAEMPTAQAIGQTLRMAARSAGAPGRRRDSATTRPPRLPPG